MCLQFLQRARLATAGKIRRRSTEHQFFMTEAGVTQRGRPDIATTDADHHIKPLFHQIHKTIREGHLRRDLRMLLRKGQQRPSRRRPKVAGMSTRSRPEGAISSEASMSSALFNSSSTRTQTW
jgi:hypothetical protein